MKTSNQNQATAIDQIKLQSGVARNIAVSLGRDAKAGAIHDLAGNIYDLAQKLKSEHAALVAVSAVAQDVCNASSNEQRQSRIEKLEIALANLSVASKGS